MFWLVFGLVVISFVWGTCTGNFLEGRFDFTGKVAHFFERATGSIFCNLCAAAMAIFVAGSAAGKGSAGYEFLQTSWWWIGLLVLTAHAAGTISYKICKTM